MTEPIIPTPEEKAKMHADWHEETFEKVKFEPKPREWLPRLIWSLKTVWTQREINIRAWRLFFWGFMVFLLACSIYFYYGDAQMPKFTIMSRIAAGVFLLAVLANFVVEFGWRGGKEINKSQM